MQLNLATMQAVEVDVESLADAALAAAPIPAIFSGVAKMILNAGLTFLFNWLNQHFASAPAAGSTVSATTHPPSAATTAPVAALAN